MFLSESDDDISDLSDSELPDYPGIAEAPKTPTKRPTKRVKSKFTCSVLLIDHLPPSMLASTPNKLDQPMGSPKQESSPGLWIISPPRNVSKARDSGAGSSKGATGSTSATYKTLPTPKKPSADPWAALKNA